VKPKGRRRFLRSAGLLAWSAALGAKARAQAGGIHPAVKEIAKGLPVNRGKVKLELPLIADNGNAVPLKVTVESPMSASDYVKAIHLLSERNPVKHMATFHLTPRSGRAEIATRVRLAGSQTVTALAELSDGSFWMASERLQVTLSACMDES
jgi:sulfur-oxidizing protein SoxY